ncbi:MAG: hypothetical protein IKH78_07795 [Ruminococcus sp.]|nr:hypothetical protein [Ruminococcus sp.]
MKYMTLAALSTLLLAGCGAGATVPRDTQPPTNQSVTEVVNPAASATEIKSPGSRVLYRERLYRPDSYTKSDLIIENDGRVWCGFYMHNEGLINESNRLCTKDGQCSGNYQLDDDRWLKAYISETAEDDFMLFGNTCELGILSETQLTRLRELTENADTGTAPDVKTASEAEDVPDMQEYLFADIVTGGRIFRISETTRRYSSCSADKNASEALTLVRSGDFYVRWRELCSSEIKPN